MSAELYSVRVYYDHDHGCVKVPGVYRSINRAPRIPGLPQLAAIDYAQREADADAHCAELMAHLGTRREMTGGEVAAVQAWLATVQAGTDGGAP